MSGASVNARARTRRGLKNEHPCSFSGVAPGHTAFGPGLVSAAKADVRPPPVAHLLWLCFLRYIVHSGLEPSAALIPPPDITSAVAALALAGLRLVFSPTIAAPTPPTIVPSRTEKATMRMSRRKCAVREKPPNSG